MEQNAYILGTELQELHRLGYQHQVWSSEARRGWEIAEFGPGQRILDLGSGPGFCSIEMGYMVGSDGSVVAVDKSQAYIDYLEALNKIYKLPIETICSDFNSMQFEPSSLDGAYSRWALAWIKDVEGVVGKVSNALVSGGVFVAHEYFDWSTFQTEPYMPGLDKGIKSILKSFKEQEGDIDIGRQLPRIFSESGLEVISTRMMVKHALPDDLNWRWPYTFLNIYMPKLVAAGYMTTEEVETALDELEELSYQSGACIFCPSMIEVVAVKP